MFKIYDSSKTKVFDFDKHFEDATPLIDKTHTTSRTVVNTFDMFPRVYRVGHTDYETLTLSTLFYTDNGTTLHEQYDAFKTFIKAYESDLYLEDGFGRVFHADVELITSRVSKLGTVGYHDYCEVVIEVIQLGEVVTTV